MIHGLLESAVSSELVCLFVFHLAAEPATGTMERLKKKKKTEQKVFFTCEDVESLVCQS